MSATDSLAAAPPAVNPAVRSYTLGLLVVIYTFNFVDRQILSILLEPIKQELQLSDGDLGWLTGFAFALFYATLGIPIALWADRSNRRNIIALALAIWSAMTALSGVAQNFWHLLIARIGVGVGEAGCSPPAHSMIADLYPAHQRATALGVYSLGIPIGIMFGFFAGGWINEWFGWRWAFFVVGVPGLILALLARFTMTEPTRGAAEGRVAAADAPTVGETARFLITRPAFLHLAFGGALAAFVGYSWVTFIPSFLIRSFGMGTGEVGTWMGLILGIPGGVGIVLGGWLSDKLGARDRRWALWIVALAMALTVPVAVASFLAEQKMLAIGLMALPIMIGNFYQASTFSQTQGLVSLRMRAVAAAVLLFIINIIGLGAGPTVTGLISEALSAEYGQESLRYALMLVSLLNIWTAFHYWMAGRHLPADLARAPD